ncbi:MAG: hypothetical protein A2944_00940 [Candidatus Zambryskibacteria bacterium RIFCSPLOWO2_01_FULL_52_12]|nr:MAG: hypothetical protein A2944_00940 [Candidatus Zambryskibacteria bacterium RIFCSPLOWO2_01_FULL_52_12]
MRILGNAVGRTLRRAAHGEFVHVGAADNNSARLLELLHDGCVVRSDKSLKNFRACRRLVAFEEHVVLDSNSLAAQRAFAIRFGVFEYFQKRV